MHDDPFARAVERVETAEQQKRDAKIARRKDKLSEGNRFALNIHATVFIAVNFLLIAIWAMVWQLNDGTSYPWFVFVLLGWGIGLAAHWAATRRHTSKRPSGLASAELERLVELHRNGSLDDEEFRAAKAKILL
ncbi:MAG: 2TM domain-containing protein [Thermoleophilaceae bacterium]|nr:2TM domain-containing protein [Thermoleophilaceae bacterium]